MVTRVGTIGYSEGNGHPFSFSAIVNGYDDAAFADCGWPVIHRYLQAQPPENFGFDRFRVTAAWTPDRAMTEKLCRACRIENIADSPQAMVGQVDAVLIARDDWQSHAPLAMPFLRAGKHVFIDKPLTLDAAELAAFRPYLEQGRLMSTSGLRYSRELDVLRDDGIARQLGQLKLIQSTVLNGLESYGIHLLEAVAGLGGGLQHARSITRLRADHLAYAVQYDGGVLQTLHCLGAVGKTFHASFFGQQQHMHFDLHDNFSAFRRTLGAFFEMVRSGIPAIAPAETLRLMETIAKAVALRPGETAQIGDTHAGDERRRRAA